MKLITLVYVSVATKKLSESELVEILEVARAKNEKLNITGMLLYRDGFFVQALEGEQAVVEDLFHVIAKDERHKNVIVVYQNSIATRSFNDWSMGFNMLSEKDLLQVEGYTGGMLNVHFFADKPGRAVTLLESFRNRSYF